ncbi:MAG: PAS domain-containing protein [Defluviitaleaceae bacterium]|nr:PAS domain-containing protein [Defluviitaleaceae bacterium]
MFGQKKYNFAILALILVVLSLVVLAAVTGALSYLSLHDENINTLKQQNRALVNYIDGWIGQKGAIVENNAMLLRNTDISPEMAMSLFIEQSERFPDISAAFVGFADGSIIFGGDWDVPYNWHSHERLWYIMSAENPGQVVLTQPYMDDALSFLTFSIARTISDYDDSLGVAAISIPFAAMMNYIERENIIPNSYSFILHQNGNILFHPDLGLIPTDYFSFQNIAEIENRKHADMFEALANYGLYSGGGMVNVSTPLETTDWYIVTRVPTSYIFRSTLPTVYGLVVTSAFSIITLVWSWYILRKIKLAMKREQEAHELSELFLRVSPFAQDLWDEDFNLVDCNRQTLDLYGLSSKEEYCEHFFDFSLEHQPCGTPSNEKILSHMKEALEQGTSRFEFMHRTKSGEILPTETTLVRIMKDGKKMIAGYVTDLRKLREVEERLKMMLDAAPMAVSLYDKNSNSVECNQEALKMFMLTEKLVAADVVTKTMPTNQPDGRNSKELLDGWILEAFEKGHAAAEFISMRSDGSLFPSAASWTRVKHKGEFVVVEYLRDLTAEKEAQESEQEANALTKLLMDRSPLCIEMWDETGELVYCNQKMMDISNVGTFEEYKNKFLEFSGERQPDGAVSSVRLADMIDKAMKDGYVRFEWTHLTANGEPIPYDAQLIRIIQNDKYMILGYSLDMREIKNAMAKIYEADERASLMLGATPMSCFMIKPTIDANGQTAFRAIDFNQSAIDLFGFSSHDEVIERFYDIFPTISESGMAVEDSVYYRVAKTMEVGYDKFEFTHQNLDGELIPCEVVLVRVEYQGEPALVCFQNDLRLVKAAMEKERSARELTQAFIDAAPFFIEIWDENLNIIDCNTAITKLFEVESKEEYVRRYDEFSPEFQPCGTPSALKSQEYVETALREGSARMEWMQVGPNGEDIPVDCNLARIPKGDGFYVATYNYDLRPMKEAMKKEREAEEESQAKTKFLARMSHEVRTPLNSVMGITEIELQKNIHNQETEEAFQRIYSSSKLLLSIINDILDLSKVEAGKMEIIPALYETASLILDTVQLNLMYVGSKRIDFTLKVDDNLPVYLIGDELRIKQILNNLISNAMKYTPEGEVSLVFRVEETDDVNDTMLIISVIDTGQGMSEEQLAKLFDMEYTRFNLEHNRTIEGSGLGMTITHSLVKMMGGSIEAESEPGKGSRFTVRIPQKIEGREVLGTEAAQSLQNLEATRITLRRKSIKAPEPMPYGRVLVVDDVESNLFVAKGFLFPYKVAVETADSAMEAIELIKKGQVYDIVFMDHMMPVMDGVQATKILRDMGYISPIVALTANATFGASKMFLENGFSDFVSKPLDPERMDVCLRRFIYDKQPADVIAAARAQYPNFDKYQEENIDISDQLIESFLIDAGKFIETVEPLTKADKLCYSNYKIYTIQTHAIKSALANIGQWELSKAAAVLEEAGRNEDSELIKDRTTAFLNSVKDITRSYKRRSEKEESDLEQDENVALISRHLVGISEACEAYDIASVQGLMSQLKEIPISNQTKKILSEIDKHLLLSDYEDAALLAKQTAEGLIGT